MTYILLNTVNMRRCKAGYALWTVVPGYPSQDAAADAAPGLKDRLELPGDPWIVRE